MTRRWLVLRPEGSGYRVEAAADRLLDAVTLVNGLDIVAVMRDVRPPTPYRRTYPRMFVALFTDGGLWMDVGPLVRIQLPIGAGQYLRRAVVRALTCPVLPGGRTVDGEPTVQLVGWSQAAPWRSARPPAVVVAIDADEPPCPKCHGVGDVRRGQNWVRCRACSVGRAAA